MTDKPFLKDFARRQWSSGAARALWEPRIVRFGAQYLAAERESVELGVRPAALQHIQPEALPEFAKRAGRRGLAVVPLSIEGRPESYAAAPVERDASGPWDYRIVFTRPEAAGHFAEAWEAGDDNTIGELLGYPECCRKHFINTWGAGSVDPTWNMCDHEGGPREANILLRWAGVRYVPHLPCAFNCQASVSLGQKIRELVAPQERAWADELLDSPMIWSSLNGLGEVMTPLFTLNFRSDASEDLREIRRSSSKYPEASARGLRFPYVPPARREEEAQPEPEDSSSRRSDPSLWTDNGFTSLEAMEEAHETIAAAAGTVFPRTVLDLGCGNGLLARKLAGLAGRAIGIEADPDRARRAEGNLDQTIEGDIFDVQLGQMVRDLDLSVLMPGRIIEQAKRNGKKPAELVSRFELLPGRLLVYAYGDWIERYGSLDEICYAAGMCGKLEALQVGSGVDAGIWDWSS